MSDDERASGDEAAEAQRRREEAQARMRAAQAKKKGGKRKGLCLTPEKKKLLKDGETIEEDTSGSDADLDHEFSAEPISTSSQCPSSTDGLSERSFCVDSDHEKSDTEDHNELMSVASDSGISSNNSTLTREEVFKLNEHRKGSGGPQISEESSDVDIQSENNIAKKGASGKQGDEIVRHGDVSKDAGDNSTDAEPKLRKVSNFELPVKRRGIFVPSDKRVLERWRSQEGMEEPERKEAPLSRWAIISNVVRKQRSSAVWPPPDMQMDPLKDRRYSLQDDGLRIGRLTNEPLTKWASDGMQDLSESESEQISPRSPRKPGRGSWLLEDDDSSKTEDPHAEIDSKMVRSITKEVFAVSRSSGIDATDSPDDQWRRRSTEFTPDKVKCLTDKFSGSQEFPECKATATVDPVLVNVFDKPKSIAKKFEVKPDVEEDDQFEKPKRSDSVLKRYQPQSNLKSMSKSLGDLTSVGLSTVEFSFDKPKSNFQSLRQRFESTDGTDSNESISFRRPQTVGRDRAKTMMDFNVPMEEKKRPSYQDDIDTLRRTSNAKTLLKRFETFDQDDGVKSPSRKISLSLKRVDPVTRTLSQLEGVKKQDSANSGVSVDHTASDANSGAKQKRDLFSRFKSASESPSQKPVRDFVQMTSNQGAKHLAQKFEELDAKVKEKPRILPTIRRKSLSSASEFFRRSHVFDVYDDGKLSSSSGDIRMDDRKSPEQSESKFFDAESRNISIVNYTSQREVEQLKSSAKVSLFTSKFDTDKNTQSGETIESKNTPTTDSSVSKMCLKFSESDTMDDVADIARNWQSVSKIDTVNKPKSSESDSKNDVVASSEGKNDVVAFTVAKIKSDLVSSSEAKNDVAFSDGKNDVVASSEGERLNTAESSNETAECGDLEFPSKVNTNLSASADPVVNVDSCSEWQSLIDDDCFDDAVDSSVNDDSISREECSKGQSLEKNDENLCAIDTGVTDFDDQELDWWEFKPKGDYTSKLVRQDNLNIAIDSTATENIGDYCSKLVRQDKLNVDIDSTATENIGDVESSDRRESLQSGAENQLDSTEGGEDSSVNIDLDESGIDVKQVMHNETVSEIETSEFSETETSEMDSEYSEQNALVTEQDDEEPCGAEGGGDLDMDLEDFANMDKAALLRKVQELYKLYKDKEDEKYDNEQRLRKQDLEINDLTSKVNDVKGKFTKPVLKKVTKTEKLSKVEKKGNMTDIRASLKSTGQSKYQLDDQPQEPKTPDWRGNLKEKGKDEEEGGEQVNGEVGADEVEAEA